MTRTSTAGGEHVHRGNTPSPPTCPCRHVDSTSTTPRAPAPRHTEVKEGAPLSGFAVPALGHPPLGCPFSSRGPHLKRLRRGPLVGPLAAPASSPSAVGPSRPRAFPGASRPLLSACVFARLRLHAFVCTPSFARLRLRAFFARCLWRAVLCRQSSAGGGRPGLPPPAEQLGRGAAGRSACGYPPVPYGRPTGVAKGTTVKCCDDAFRVPTFDVQ